MPSWEIGLLYLKKQAAVESEKKMRMIRAFRGCIRKAKALLQKAYRIFLKLFYVLNQSRLSRISSMNADEAAAILQQYSPKPEGTGIRENRLESPFLYDLQIIVPAYNVEKYLRQCLESILGQKTKYRYHVTIVDDGSVDATGAIADAYAADPRVTVIHQENRGFSGARNRALETISGKYLMFVDSDDMLAEHAIETLMDTAEEKHARIVQGAFFNLYSESEINIAQKTGSAKRVEPALGNLSGFPWGKVFDSRLFQNLIFPEGFWFEDSAMSFLCYPRVTEAYVLPQTVYIYRRANPNSISNTFSQKPKCVDSFYITQLLMREHHEQNLPVDQTYVEKVFRQIELNETRIRNVPEKVKEAVFILTADLVEQFLPTTVQSGKYRHLNELIRQRDYGLYRYYVKWH